MPTKFTNTIKNCCPMCRSETYQYYTLPFCTPKEGKEYKPEGLGEVLEGDRLVNTPYDIKFRVDKENEDLCSRELTAKDLKRLRTAVKKDYYFQVISNLRDSQLQQVIISRMQYGPTLQNG